MKTHLSWLLLGLGCLSTGLAQKAAPLYVSFSFKDTSAPLNFSGVTKVEVETQITQLLAERFNEQLRYWSVMPSTNAADAPQLAVWLTEATDWELRMQLLGPQRVPFPNSKWATVVIRPGDLSRFANKMKWEAWAKLVRDGAIELLEDNFDSVRTALLAHAPVGKDVLLDDPPLIEEPLLFTILPLDWDVYGAELLGVSDFTIQCLSPTGMVKLHSVGIGRGETFTPKNPRGYDGVVVRLTEWEDSSANRTPIGDHKAQLAALQPLGIYLRAINPISVRVAP
jgi:hypothetical protein